MTRKVFHKKKKKMNFNKKIFVNFGFICEL